MRRGKEFSIILDHYELMNSRLGGSEEALATIACERIRCREEPRILIGGLGMGFTLRAARAALGTDARIIVAELVPAVVGWARGPMAEVFGKSLTDPRVSIREADVSHLFRSDPSTFDAILLDVDNGPEGLTRKANDALYDLEGLSAARAALRPSGTDERYRRRIWLSPNTLSAHGTAEAYEFWALTAEPALRDVTAIRSVQHDYYPTILITCLMGLDAVIRPHRRSNWSASAPTSSRCRVKD